jgi:hypothetical protein
MKVHGHPIIALVCTVCDGTINAGDLCSYGCTEDNTPHAGTSQAVIYKPDAAVTSSHAA